jgi:hypothetical protein
MMAWNRCSLSPEYAPRIDGSGRPAERLSREDLRTGSAPAGLDGSGPCACRCIYHVLAFLPFCDEGFIQREIRLSLQGTKPFPMQI